MTAPCFVPCVSYLPTRRPRATSTRPTLMSLRRHQLAAKSFQLEEMEDSANQTSALFLQDDGGVAVGQTDGPDFDRADGKWTFNEREGFLEIEIERFFGADSIPFSVKRIFRGHADDGKSGLALFVGAMFRDPTDFGPEEALGHFALVESTLDLPNLALDGSRISNVSK